MTGGVFQREKQSENRISNWIGGDGVVVASTQVNNSELKTENRAVVRMAESAATKPHLENDVEIRGFLLKWTNYIKGYQRRWFVLSKGVLSYYRFVIIFMRKKKFDTRKFASIRPEPSADILLMVLGITSLSNEPQCVA